MTNDGAGPAPPSRRAQPAGAVACDFLSKNNAWLMTALTFSGWNGLVMRKVGSGRTPVNSNCG